MEAVEGVELTEEINNLIWTPLPTQGREFQWIFFRKLCDLLKNPNNSPKTSSLKNTVLPEHPISVMKMSLQSQELGCN